MRINVSDRNRFISFLGALEQEKINATGLPGHLEGLANILSQQILDHYNFNSNIPSDDILQLFGGLEKIIAEYKRLGMGASVERLEIYLTHSRMGDLREYISIERRGLFSEPGKFFGPADWQRDSAPQYLENRWSESIWILRMAKENPKAVDLYRRLQQHLTMCVRVALDNVQTLEYFSPEHRQESKTILEKARRTLDGMADYTPLAY